MYRFAFACATLLSSSVVASPYAVEVVSYTPGTLPDALSSYTQADAALGRTNDFNPAFPDFDVPASIVTPFNATYTTDDLVAIGTGGSLVLRLDEPAGDALGVHTGVGLNDAAYPSGQTGPTALAYTGLRQAGLRVSSDGVTFVDVAPSGTIFDVPTNVFADAPGPYAETAGNVEADFSQPFFGTLSDFDNQDFAGVLDVLDGSAGGTWFDLSGTGLGEINYVEFFVDEPGQTMVLDGVGVAGVVPEPATLGGLLVLGTLLLRRRA